MRVPVLAGPLRGAWWYPASGGKVLRVLVGTYEPEQVARFHEHLTEGATFLDVGAHVGFYTVLGARLVGPAGSVWAFEPEPTNARWLRKHVSANRLDQVEVRELAVSASAGVARFGGGTGTGTGRLAEEGDIQVQTVDLDGFCHERGVRPDAIKIDVEGAEADVLTGGSDMLAEARPVIFLSVHGGGPRDRCVDILQGLGYELEPMDAATVASADEILARPGQ